MISQTNTIQNVNIHVYLYQERQCCCTLTNDNIFKWMFVFLNLPLKWSWSIFLLFLQKQFNLSSAGLYSIHLTANDKAGNYKTTRRFVLYDNNSHVSHNPFMNSRVETATKNTNYTWIVDNTTPIYVTWKGRFRNALHHHNKWLNKISPSHGISEPYDDYTGVTNVNYIKNVYGEQLCFCF